jgi:hypothetical protein
MPDLAHHTCEKSVLLSDVICKLRIGAQRATIYIFEEGVLLPQYDNLR